MINKVKTNIIITFFAAFTIVCALGVLLAVYLHDEKTFMENGAAWHKSQFPLGVCGKAHTPSDQKLVESLLKDALKQTNDELDFYALKYVEDVNDPGCLITGTYGVPVEQGWIDQGGHANWTPYVSCRFRIANPPPGLETLIIQHELGHCLGLDHDQYEASIMYWDARREDVKYPPRISDEDKKAIRDLYLGGK